MITEVSLELGRTCRLTFVSSSARIILHDRFFLTGLSVFELGRDLDRIDPSMDEFTESLRTVNYEELENLSPLRSRNLL